MNQPQSDRDASTSRDASLEWKMAFIDANTNLKLEYQVKNLSKSRIYVCDQLLITKNNKFVRTNQIVVVNGKMPGVVDFVRGVISPDVPVMVVYQPTYIALEPGETTHGNAVLGWPLKTWHNVARVNPLLGTPTRAVLDVQYFVGEPPEWTSLPTDELVPIRVPRGQISKRLQTEQIPIPIR